MNWFSCYFFSTFVKKTKMKTLFNECNINKRIFFRIKYIVLFVFVFILNLNAQSQSFSLDTTFNVNFNFYSPGNTAIVYGLNYEPDGKLMIFGDFYNGLNSMEVLRIYNDGNIDSSFNYIWDWVVDYIKLQNNK